MKHKYLFSSFNLLIALLFLFIFESCEEDIKCVDTKENNLEVITEITIPTIDISGDESRQVVIAQGTDEVRQGHPSTLLLPDGKTMFVIWTRGHGGSVDFLKKSEDGGQTWSDYLEIPDNWYDHGNCPALYLLEDPDGTERIFSFANHGPDGFFMYRTVSEDLGNSWSPFEPCLKDDSDEALLSDVMPFTSIISVEDGQKLLGFTNIRRPYDNEEKSNILVQSYSTDGGFTWSDWRIILDLGEPFRTCEPEVIRSPDGEQLMMIIRENRRSYNSWIMLSNNEGVTWSEPYQATASVTMDRHQACYSNDGRLVIVGRDVASESTTKTHFVAWVGTYEDLINGKEGQYRIKLLHTYKTTEYPGLEVLPDGTFVATNSVSRYPGENHSLVSTRFTLEEMDELVKEGN